MAKRLITGIVFLFVLAGAFSAYAQVPDVRAWVETPRFVTPGTGEYEWFYVRYRNKGGAPALNTVITINLPPGFTRVAGSGNPYSAASPLAVSNTVYSYAVAVTVAGSVAVGTPLTVNINCSFNDGTNNYNTSYDWIIDVVQFPITQVVPGDRIYNAAWADYSPDGSKIAYSGTSVSYGSNNQVEIYSVNPDGTNPTRLTENSGCDTRPVYSPDGSMIAWQCYSDTNYVGETWVMNSDGTNPHQVAGAHFNNPQWLTNSKLLTFAGDGTYTAYPYTVWMVNTDGSNLHQVSRPSYVYVQHEYDTDPTGRYLFTSSNYDWYALHKVYVTDLIDPDNPVGVGSFGFLGEAQMVQARPNSSGFVFMDDFIGNGQLYSKNIDNTGLLQLTAEKRVYEYQLSDNATTVTLDNEYILKVEGVWLASDVTHGGTNYIAGGDYYVWTETINLGVPLSDEPAARVPVVVTYTYIPDYFCSAKPHYSADGQWITYISDQDYYRAVWVMKWDGSMKTRLTFNDEDDYGSYDEHTKRLPIIRSDSMQVLYSTWRFDYDLSLATINLDLSTIPDMPHAKRE